MTKRIRVTADDMRCAPHVPGYSGIEILRRVCERAGLTDVNVYSRDLSCEEGISTTLPFSCRQLIEDPYQITESFECDITIQPWDD